MPALKHGRFPAACGDEWQVNRQRQQQRCRCSAAQPNQQLHDSAKRGAAEVVASRSKTNLTYRAAGGRAGLYSINLLPVGRFAPTVTTTGFETAARTAAEAIVLKVSR